ncbi:hypothetical protein CHS0354_039364 [Potamilus streckersoni]|uniref:Uncharacterized protein n=1 Tax=Potamilus streckersoni TaxID=2493646 RepID=A0AAE0T3A8_9BIVA|nr:hypothetical protein CHS0354_039364 [Potamilus streckersoni]
MDHLQVLKEKRNLHGEKKIPPNLENVTSNPELNLNVPRTGTYTYGTDDQEHVTQGSPPPYIPTLLCEPITPFAPLSYTLGSNYKSVAPMEPPAYTPNSPSLPPTPYSEFV